MSEKPISNPYWDEVKDYIVGAPGVVRGAPEGLQWDLRRRYSLAIPDPSTVAFVARFLGARAVEIGAGTGYWSWLLAQVGTTVEAYDRAPPDRVTTNGCHSPRDASTGDFLGLLRPTFHPVSGGGPPVLARYAEHTLFLCWPPYRQPMSAECLALYPGRRLVYLGEGRGGGCASRAFFARLGSAWHEVACHTPVRWHMLHDQVTVFERGPRGRAAGQV